VVTRIPCSRWRWTLVGVRLCRRRHRQVTDRVKSGATPSRWRRRRLRHRHRVRRVTTPRAAYAIAAPADPSRWGVPPHRL